MKWQPLHPWPQDARQAVQLQLSLAPRVSREGDGAGASLVGGVDISHPDPRGVARGAVVVLSYPSLDPVEVRTAQGKPPFPYVPGLLAFRELPLILAALEKLSQVPQLILVDGQGLAHPRRFGIACHLGLWLDLPTIGCAKSLLIGDHTALGEEPGSWATLRDRAETVGAAVRTRPGAAPVYVSIGHRVNLEAARAWVMKLVREHRLPEPLRLAHLAASGRLEEGVARPLLPGLIPAEEK